MAKTSEWNRESIKSMKPSSNSHQHKLNYVITGRCGILFQKILIEVKCSFFYIFFSLFLLLPCGFFVWLFWDQIFFTLSPTPPTSLSLVCLMSGTKAELTCVDWNSLGRPFTSLHHVAQSLYFLSFSLSRPPLFPLHLLFSLPHFLVPSLFTVPSFLPLPPLQTHHPSLHFPNSLLLSVFSLPSPTNCPSPSLLSPSLSPPRSGLSLLYRTEREGCRECFQ